MLTATSEEIKEYRDKYTNPLYLSTHGDGVSWLHFRLEKNPKYYSYKPYTKT